MFRERNTWDECVQWITEEFTDLIENSPLPLKSEGETYARMNRGIAKAYLARILYNLPVHSSMVILKYNQYP